MYIGGHKWDQEIISTTPPQCTKLNREGDRLFQMVLGPCMEGPHRWGHAVCGRDRESDTCWVASFKDGLVY